MITLLIDSHCLGYQVRYALGQLSHDDMRTGTIYGFLASILQLGLHFETNDIVFFWDSKTSERKKIFPGYKLRIPKPEEAEERRIMRIQLRKLRRKILPRMGFVNNFIQAGYESDDLLASFVNGRHGEFIIVSSDQDMYQCLEQQNVKIYNPLKKKIYTSGRFGEEHGIDPSQWVAVKSIGGCRSDTVPGIRGVAEKTAIKYLRGELKKTTKAYQDIISPDGAVTIARNKRLVKLPYPGTRKDFSLVTTNFRHCKRSFQGVCRKYGFDSFLEGDKWKEWKQLFYMTEKH